MPRTTIARWLAAASLAGLAPSMAIGLRAGAAEGEAHVASRSEDRSDMIARIDQLLRQAWDRAGVAPAPAVSDAAYLRRASLDLTGVIPRVAEVREFSTDASADKRAQLVDRLLSSSRYATHMATTWRNRILPQGVEPARAREAAALQKWLRSRFARNLRYDNLVGGLLLTAGGDDPGPALYFQTHDLAPEKMAASAAELFLGVKLQCAQCHDHPFADWSQREFWGFAAFFARVKAPENRGMMRTAYRLVDVDYGDVRLPDSTEAVAPKYPRGETAEDAAQTNRRMQLVLWMTSRDNPFFARAAVNWAWSHMFGRPLIATLDDDDDKAEPSPQEQLLDELADYFVQSGFDLQELWRVLAGAQAYQLAGAQAGEAPPEPELFARMLPKALTPEQLYDCYTALAPDVGEAYGAGGASRGLEEDPNRMEFVRRMRPPPGEVTEYRAGTLQALLLMNGRATAAATASDHSSLIGALTAPYMTDGDRVDALFLATFSREPEAVERRAFVEALEQCQAPEERRQALSDMFWALLNSTEFAFNH
jgi:hypothetical protein